MSKNQIKADFKNDTTQDWGLRRKLGTFVGAVALWLTLSALIYTTINAISKLY